MWVKVKVIGSSLLPHKQRISWIGLYWANQSIFYEVKYVVGRNSQSGLKNSSKVKYTVSVVNNYLLAVGVWAMWGQSEHVTRNSRLLANSFSCASEGVNVCLRHNWKQHSVLILYNW